MMRASKRSCSDRQRGRSGSAQSRACQDQGQARGRAADATRLLRGCSDRKRGGHGNNVKEMVFEHADAGEEARGRRTYFDQLHQEAAFIDNEEGRLLRSRRWQKSSPRGPDASVSGRTADGMRLSFSALSVTTTSRHSDAVACHRLCQSCV